MTTDPIDVPKGLKVLRALGYDGWQSEMVIEHSLRLWVRGEGEVAEKKALDLDFHGIDHTSWRMVLAAAIAEGIRKLRGSK